MDLRIYKKELRSRFRKLRSETDAETKRVRDEKIFARVISSRSYRSCTTLLTYVSTDIEVDTKKLISRALQDGKTVAVPKCTDKRGTMLFYVINGFGDLEVSTYSLLEPKTDICPELTDIENSLCIVPGLVFDMNGYRLGYGGGYYDRFLSAHPGMHKMGICYCCCTVQKLIPGYYDSPVNSLATEKYMRTFP